MLKKIVWAAICLITLLSAFFFFRKTKNNTDTLCVGMMSGWAPFMAINNQAEFEGFDVDVATAIAKRLGKQLVIKDLGSLAACFIALEQNKVDMILSGLDITQQRLEKMHMVPYVGQGIKEYFLVFWNKIPENVSRIEDLKKMKNPVVCIEPGNSSEKFLDRFDYILKKPLTSLSDIILDLQYGKSLAAFLEPQVVGKLMPTKPEIKYMSVPLPPEFQIFGCGIALKKENESLKNKITEIVRQLKQEGTIKQLEAKWQVTGV